MTARERMLVRSAVAAALLGAAAWGYARLDAARDAAASAAASLAECRRLAALVEARRGPGAVAAGASEPRAADLVGRIEAAAKAAGLPEGGVESIQPGAARRVADDETLLEKPAVVTLNLISLRQLFTFLHALGGPGTGRPGLHVKDVRLTAPSADDTGDRWSVEGTLAYLVRETPGETGR